MKYLIRIYNGTLQYICLVNTEKKHVNTVEYKILEQLYCYSDRTHLYDKDQIGISVNEMIKNEKEVLEYIFNKMEK